VAKQSKAEIQFKAKYRYAHVRGTDRYIAGYEMVQVFCGDYICAEGLTAARAYKLAMELDAEGLISPDPNERRSVEAPSLVSGLCVGR
jgi:hypothetical protein